MKKSLLWILLSIVVNNLSAQSYTAIYKYMYQPDSTKSDNKKDVKTVLNINKFGSHFATEANLRRDSIFNEVRSKKVSAYDMMDEMRMLNKISRFSFIVAKNYQSGETTMHESIVSTRFKYVETTPLDWQLKEESKLIMGYSCQKAEIAFGGRNYIAWYTTEIPFSDGPHLFHGLPGLIVSLEDTRDHHHFQMLSFTKNTTISTESEIPYQNENYRLTSKDRFLLAKRSYISNPDAFMEAAGFVVMSKDAPKANPWRDTSRNPIILNEY